MLKSVYWEDGTDDHGLFVGNAMEFCDFIMEYMPLENKTMHMVSNMYVEFEGSDDARVETYMFAFTEYDGRKGPKEPAETTAALQGGRYIDRFQRRAGEWRIFHRVYVFDWNQVWPTREQSTEGFWEQLTTRGARSPNDPWDLGLPKVPS
jgi:hypothetical protein